MKFILTMSNRGSVALPVKLRRALGLRPDHRLIAEITSEGLLLRPGLAPASERYSSVRLAEFEDAEAELAKVLVNKACNR